VDKHGSESYSVLGEGLLSESGDGRAAVVAGAAAPPPFRFSRMGPRGVNRQLGEGNRRKIALEMAAGGGGQSRIPAGFTYLGQFIDHDLTFETNLKWMIRTDYLPRICARSVVNNVFNQGRKASEVGVSPTDLPTMPIESSVAAQPAR
jgi:hypothetical protein